MWEWFLRGLGLVVLRVCAVTLVSRALSSGACARALVVIQCLCVLVSSVSARTRFVLRRAFMQPLLVLVWQANEVAL